MVEFLIKNIRQAKRMIIGLIGFSVVLLGIAMIVLPGPAILIIPMGLGILATEFVWARILLNKLKEKTIIAGKTFRRNKEQ